MRALPAAVVLCVALATLAGCTGGGEPAPAPLSPAERPTLEQGRGAIAGLLVDDRYRPIPEAKVTLFPLGAQAETDTLGQFLFLDLDPGAYQLQVDAPGHEAAPQPVDVEKGVYTEVEVEARRTFSDLSDIITEQYSVFVPCAVSAVIVTAIMQCILDGSDSYDWGFTSDYSGYNATFAVSEFRASQPDGYYVSWGCGSDGLAGNTFEGVYTRIVLEVGGQRNGTIRWTNQCPLDATLFYVGSAGPTAKQAGLSWGVGARFAIKGTFLNSVFLGPPLVDPLTHAVLQPSGQD